jgi:non-ribosomal peptide synthetase component F
VNEALVLKTEAARLQSEASNQWAYYQAKGIKSAAQEASRSAWIANGKTPPREFEESTEKYAAQQAEIQKEAQAREHERDAKSEEADHLLHRHHGFAKSVAIFQVAIALGAVAALTRNRLVWFGSLLLGWPGPFSGHHALRLGESRSSGEARA